MYIIYVLGKLNAYFTFLVAGQIGPIGHPPDIYQPFYVEKSHPKN